MKLRNIILTAISGSFLLAGCKKSFLETLPTEFTTPEQESRAVEQDPTLLNGNINGLYSAMFTVGIGGTTRHDDFGQKGVDIYSDMISSDMVLGAVNYGWYSGIARLRSTIDFTTSEDYIPFRYYYRIIYGANTVLDLLGGSDATPADGAKVGFAQAKVMRAYGYFYLSQLYAKEYGDGSQKILPIYTTAVQDSLNRPKRTAKEVWDLMVSDLTQAIGYLDGYSRKTKDQVDVYVAKGLLAYVLAARGTPQDWAQVESLTQDIMARYPKTTAAELVYNGTNLSVAGFNNVATPSWMWGVDITLSQGLDLISWWGQVDLYTYSYAWAGDPKIIDQGLYDQIRSDDIRKSQFDSDLMPVNKFFDPGRKPGGQRQITTDLLYMRSDEFYLLNAEAKAHQSKDGEARDVLKSFLSNRISDLTYIDLLSGQDLLNEIYLQTRIELWGEGKSYLAMKRNKATITRGDNHLYEAGNSFQYNDPRLTFVIPQAEVLNNPNLDK